MKKNILFLALTLAVSSAASAKIKVDFNEFRAETGGEKNTTVIFNALLDAYKGVDGLTVTFHDERYDFYPVEQEEGVRCAGMDLSGIDGLTIEGNGAEFIFHGKMGISLIRECSGITMKDFSMDWDRPIISQGEVLDVTDDYLDLSIDGREYPHYLTDGHLMFTGEGWESPIIPLFDTIYDSNGDVQYNTWDGTFGKDLANAPVEKIGENRYRFHFQPKYKPAMGSYILLFNGHYEAYGIRALRSRDLRFENLTMYHAMGAGITGDFCENVTEINVRIIANKAKGRMFSTEADAQHYRNCKGLILMKGGECSGQADDFVNVHGVYYKVLGITGPKSLSVNKSYDFSPGEKVAFLHPVSGQREYMLTVADSNDKEVIFEEELPAAVDNTFYIENYTWTPSFIFEDNNVTKGNRARGILFTTPKPVIIRNNHFHSAGTAILIEGDIDVWFESGANGNVDIYGNVFDNCLTSGNREGGRWQWGDGIITITPSHRPVDAQAPAYHRNIRIHDNVFRMFDTSIMRACSVDGLQFKRNTIVRTYDYKPYTYYKDSFTLEGCRNVVIKGNRIDKDYETRTISTTLMDRSEVRAKGFSVR